MNVEWRVKYIVGLNLCVRVCVCGGTKGSLCLASCGR